MTHYTYHGGQFLSNPYITPVTIEFGSSDSGNAVNLPVKYRIIFIVLELLDCLVVITTGDKVIAHPLEFPMGTEYIEIFHVIADKKTKFPRYFVHYELH